MSIQPFATWEASASAWLDEDLRLMTSDDGWKSVIHRADLEISSRPSIDDPNHLFRWKLPIVAATADVVFDAFVARILEFHKEWTREYAGGHVVETMRPDARVLYQCFEPGIPGISNRDLCSLELVKDLSPGVKLASFRSIDRLPSAKGFERIDWWGAALCTTRPDGQSSELVYLDRENQGGAFPSWLMNRMMPRYLVLQAEAVSAFFTAQVYATSSHTG